MSIAAVNVRNPFRDAPRRDRLARVLVIPGLYSSGPAHWQTWLEAQYGDDAVRVEQDDWSTADLDRWAARIADAVQAFPGERWVAVAHSFGCLALAHYLRSRRDSVTAALFVAPADPRKFRVEHRLPLSPLRVPSTLLASETDPWMRLETAGAWSLLWAARFHNLGAVGHVNTGSGFGPFPLARQIIDGMRRAGVTDAPARSIPIPLRHTDLRFAL